MRGAGRSARPADRVPRLLRAGHARGFHAPRARGAERARAGNRPRHVLRLVRRARRPAGADRARHDQRPARPRARPRAAAGTGETQRRGVADHAPMKVTDAVALEATGVKKIYRKDGREMPVLDVGSFIAREGEFITIIGPSGCGKSTFLHIMGGFIPAESGTIRV